LFGFSSELIPIPPLPVVFLSSFSCPVLVALFFVGLGRFFLNLLWSLPGKDPSLKSVDDTHPRPSPPFVFPFYEPLHSHSVRLQLYTKSPFHPPPNFQSRPSFFQCELPTPFSPSPLFRPGRATPLAPASVCCPLFRCYQRTT